MSSVPTRRAGAGSAMNDATRELGAALGVAVLGSVAASRYAMSIDRLTATLSPADQAAARSSLAGAQQTAAHLPTAAGKVLTAGADHAFVDGIHLAVTAGAILAASAAVLVWRYLPSSVAHEGAMEDSVSAMEDTAELGLGGVPPIFADDSR
jgi:hypothetical protein